MNRRLLSLVVLVGAVLVGCGGTEAAPQVAPQAVEQPGTLSQELVTCSAQCPNGPAISCTGTTCSATNNSHVTCDGVPTYCQTGCTAAYFCSNLHGTSCYPNKSRAECCMEDGTSTGGCLCSAGSWVCTL